MSRGHFIGLNHHRLMLADGERMARYREAIEAAVRPGMRVLDLGTGTGILALWAAARGAEVVALEPHDVIAVARRLAAHNGLGDRITFVQAPSQDVTLDAPVDLVITEAMGNFFVTDEMQPVLRDLPRHMAPGATTIPRGLSLHVAGASLPLWREVSFWEDPVGGFDFSPAVDFALQHAYVVRCEPELLVTEPATVAAFPLVEAPDTLDLRARLTVTRAWALDAIVGWFEADLGHGVRLSTAPGVRTHWGQMAFPVRRTKVRAGDVLDVRLTLEMDEGLRSRFRWRGQVERPRPGGGAPEIVSSFELDTSGRFAPGGSHEARATDAQGQEGSP